MDFEFDLTVWSIPHHRYPALLLHIDGDLAAEGLPGGYAQHGLDIGCDLGRQHYLMYEHPHSSFDVTKDDLSNLVTLMDAMTYSLRDPKRPHRLGETRYGLRVERGFREFSALWSGPPDEDKQLSDLFEAVVAIYRRSFPDE